MRRATKLLPEPAKRPPTPAWTLALLYAGMGIACLASLAFPASDAGPLPVDRAVGTAAVAVGAILYFAGYRLSRGTLQTAAGLATVLISLLVAASPADGPALISATGYLWVSVYVAHFFSRSAVKFHATLITVGFAMAIHASELTNMVTAWLTIGATVWIAGLSLNHVSVRLRRMASVDQLTGALNRHGLERAAIREIALATRSRQPLTVAVIDLDDFKSVNDRRGHAAGDRLLAALTDSWRVELRAGDILARVGGDEFVLLLPCTKLSDAHFLISRLRSVSPTAWSVGIERWHPSDSLGTTLARADKALYENKLARGVGGHARRRLGRPTLTFTGPAESKAV